MGNCRSDQTTVTTQSIDQPGSLPNFKVVIVGDLGVGKTAVFNRFCHNCFYHDYKPTKKVNIGNVVRKVNIPHNTIISLTIWDLPGCEDVDLSDTYYKNINAAVVVVDANNPDSLEMASYWRQQIVNSVCRTDEITTSEALKIPTLLVANKADLIEGIDDIDDLDMDLLSQHEDQVISEKDEEYLRKLKIHKPYFDKVNEIANNNGYISGVLVSSRSPDGAVHSAVQTLARNLVERHYETINKPQKKRRRVKKETLTGYKALDLEINDSREAIRKISELKDGFHKSLDAFKLACADAEVIPAAQYQKVSLEQCIAGLKLSTNKKHELSVTDIDEDLVQLHVVGQSEARGELARILEKFNSGALTFNQFATVCGLVLSSHDTLVGRLKSIDNEIMEQYTCAELKISDETNEDKRKRDIQKLENIVDTSRADIVDSIMTIEELNKEANRARERIKASINW